MDLTVDGIFERIYVGEERIRIQLADKREAESLRVQLHKRFSEIRALEATSTTSLCHTFDRGTGIAEYWIGEKRDRRGFFTLVESSGESAENVNATEHRSTASQL